MKTFSAALFFYLILNLNISGQIPRGAKMIGGNIGAIMGPENADISSVNLLATYENQNARMNAYVTGTAGYLIAQNMAIGIKPFFSLVNYENSIYGISPFIRKYIRINDTWYFFLEGLVDVNKRVSRSNATYSFQYSPGKYETYPVVVNTTYNTKGVSLSSGVSYFISPKVSIEAKVLSIFFSRTYKVNKLSDYGMHEVHYFKNHYNDHGARIGLPPVNLSLIVYLRN